MSDHAALRPWSINKSESHHPDHNRNPASISLVGFFYWKKRLASNVRHDLQVPAAGPDVGYGRGDLRQADAQHRPGLVTGDPFGYAAVDQADQPGPAPCGDHHHTCPDLFAEVHDARFHIVAVVNVDETVPEFELFDEAGHQLEAFRRRFEIRRGNDLEQVQARFEQSGEFADLFERFNRTFPEIGSEHQLFNVQVEVFVFNGQHGDVGMTDHFFRIGPDEGAAVAAGPVRSHHHQAGASELRAVYGFPDQLVGEQVFLHPDVLQERLVCQLIQPLLRLGFDLIEKVVVEVKVFHAHRRQVIDMNEADAGAGLPGNAGRRLQRIQRVIRKIGQDYDRFHGSGYYPQSVYHI